MPLSSLSEALGGLGLFILGMKTMSEGLQRISGERFRYALERITGNRFAAALIGSGLAVLLQSSTTASVIVIGFVNAGLISLYQALGVLLATGLGLSQLLHLYVPALPVQTPVEYVLLALAVSLVVGLASGLLPAHKASTLDPVVALVAE